MADWFVQWTIVYNYYFGVVTLSSFAHDYEPVLFSTRYWFSQFWAEFSRDVLGDFHEQELQMLKKRLENQEKF